jgi:hypothetical protein
MRYILGFLISIGLLILVFVMIFRGGGNAPAPNVPAQLVDYANTNVTVQFIDDYPVNADQTHRQLTTTVGRDVVTFAVESGYQGTVLREKSYNNNPTAYANFLRALQIAGYNSANTDPALRDERGYCPTGHRYIMLIKDNERTVQRLWSTSCGNIGSFKGRIDTVRTLYLKQVPDFNELTRGVQLNF